MIKTHIYLDYNATTPLHPKAWEVMEHILSVQNAAYNASSVHYFGREGRKYIEDAREQVAKLVGATANQVTFNSGATEGNNTVLLHFAKTYPDETILISDAQHPSIMQSLNILDNIKVIPIDNNGIIKPDIMEQLLSDSPKVSLVSIAYANNETGVIQNISELSKIIHQRGALLHCDATQSVGRIAVNMQEDGIDFLTLSSHKIGGAQGVGALITAICGQSLALLFGGGQEKHLRAGTQNVAGIASFGAAAKAALQNTTENRSYLRDKLEGKLKALSPNITIHCENSPRLPNTSFFSIKGLSAQNILMALDLEGIAISNGSACSSGSVKLSAALNAMGTSEETASNALRISTGWATKESDIDTLIIELKKIITRMENK